MNSLIDEMKNLVIQKQKTLRCIIKQVKKGENKRKRRSKIKVNDV